MKNFFSVLFCIMLFITGCQKFRKPEISRIIYYEPQNKIEQDLKPVLNVQRYVGGYSVENRPVEYLIIGDGDDIILILSAIHGDERGGIYLTDYMLQYFQNYPDLLENRRVVIVPVVNPDGVAKNSRYNACGVDLNRNFFAWNRLNNLSFGNSGLSEPETQVIHRLIWKYFPSRIVSIHEGDNLECIDYDGPGNMLAERMASYCELSVQKLGAKPGSLGSYTGEALKIPTITVELPKNISYTITPEQLWNLYGNALIASVLYPDYPENYPAVNIKAVKFSDTNEDELNTNLSDFP